MIKIEDGELIDYMPQSVKNLPEVISISHAIKQAWDSVHSVILKTYIYCMIDTMPAELLDFFATELRCIYYSSDFPEEAKRKILKQAIDWTIKGGTVGALESILAAVYGEAEESDWFEYNGAPGHFKIKIKAYSTFDMSKIFQILPRIKRESAWLDEVQVEVPLAENNVYVGHGTMIRKDINLRSVKVGTDQFYENVYMSQVPLVSRTIHLMEPRNGLEDFLQDSSGKLILDDSACVIESKGG